LDIGNTRLKYWITEHDQIIEQAAELHLQSPADLLLGLIQHFKALGLHQVGLSSVQDKINNERILSIRKSTYSSDFCSGTSRICRSDLWL